jgi:GAF domain-containing protein
MSDTQTAPMRPAHDPTGRRRMAGPSAGRRDVLLAAVAHAAEVLTRTPDLPLALVEAGRVLGEAAGVDRVNVFRYDHDGPAGFLYAEWARAGVTPTSQIDAGPYGYAEYAEVWRPLLAGEVYHSPLPEKTGANAALNVAMNTKTDLFVPVFVEEHFWGTLNFDDCTTERAWTDGEIDVLRTAAAAVAAAVRREGLERRERAGGRGGGRRALVA